MENLYNSIFTRKSIRKYSKAPLSNEMLEKIKEKIKELKALDDTIRYEIVIQNDDQVTTMIKAPQYLCFYSERKGIYLMNAGYLLQQMDLTFSAMGIGACWVGIAKPHEEKINGLSFVILLAFGEPVESVHRSSVSEFTRKSLAELTDLKNCEELLTPVRLAPSATNSQPWRFSSDGKSIIVSREKLNIIKESFLGEHNQIDTGIALCHLQISAEHMGKTVKFDFDERIVPKNSIFMAAATLKNK